MSQSKQGVLILGFNRPELLRACLKALIANPMCKNLSAFFSLDGARLGDENEEKAVEECLAIFKEFESSFGQVLWLVSHLNQGLRAKVLSSVDYAFDYVDELVVLEDDCILGNNSFSFFLDALNLFKRNPNIGAVSGTYLGPTLPRRVTNVFEAQRFNSWGWATWKDVWEDFRSSHFSIQPAKSLSKEMLTLTREYPLPYRVEYSRMSRKIGNLDTWAIPFGLYLKSQNIKTLKPTKNMVTNSGFGLNATHTRTGSLLSRRAKNYDFESLSLPRVTLSRLIEGLEAWNKALLLAAAAGIFIAKGSRK
jgi:hypothetical protein